MRTTALLLSAAGALAANTTTYDYIVVGGGTAGIVAATRFAETGASVLLLERGAASAHSTGNDATLAWNDTVTPFDVPAYGYAVRGAVPAAASCADTASNAGCVLGGGGSVNAEMFVPPHAADFAAWPRGWRWEDGVREAAERVRARNPGSSRPSGDGRYYNGEVFELLGRGLLGANGWREVDAIEQPDEKHDVYARPPWNVQDAVRSGPVRTYLPDAQALPNFTLQLHAKVLRVVRTGGTATGVEIEQEDGTREVIHLTSASTGKVVLAAGALSTPRLLFNSGIGPAAQIGLVANGTDDIALPPRRDWIDLPVGEGVQDHPIFYINLNLTSPSNTTHAPLPFFDPENPSPADIRLYNAAGAGPLAQGPQRLNFWTSRTTTNSSSSSSSASSSSSDQQRSFQGTVTLASPTTISLKIYLTRGLTSRGVLGLNATSPHRTVFTAAPWLASASDRASIVAFLDELLSLLRTDAAAAASWTAVDWVSGAEIGGAEELLRTYTAGAHFVGTTALGKVVEEGSAEGPRVRGTRNLFVVDAGVFPHVPMGNTNAVVMVVAEHAAGMIVGGLGRR
ncbi:hypothetical protein SLS58_005590 [Diplodia intermedia]|uniref:Glucose-methanol-choline oxidoreductase N-terminal domain-containing protein n=1 Tax=Diplodia intermedia TaxID=856260 RepID=A0ABR3TQW3_9PEZI